MEEGEDEGVRGWEAKENNISGMGRTRVDESRRQQMKEEGRIGAEMGGLERPRAALSFLR